MAKKCEERSVEKANGEEDEDVCAGCNAGSGEGTG